MRLVNRAVRLGVGVAAAAVALAACSSGGSGGSTSASSGGVYTFGLVTSSSGPFASNYKTMVAGAQYAAKLINDKGGINGAKIEFDTVDLQNNPQNGVTQVPKLAGSVLAVVGPVDSAGCDIVCSAANKLKLPTISPGAARPGVLDNARPYAFSLAQPDAGNSTPVLEKVMTEKGFKTAAIITDSTNETTKAQQALYETVFKATGVKVTKVVTFASGDSSVASQITAVKATSPDVLALAAGPDDAGRIAQEARSQGLKATLIGTGSLQSGGAAYYAAGKAATEGTISAAQYDPTAPDQPAKGLLTAAQVTTGQEQIPLNFAYAFDALNMMVKIVKEKGIKPGDVSETAHTTLETGLNSMGAYQGMAGTTKFNTDGTALRPQLMSIMRNGEFVIEHSG